MIVANNLLGLNILNQNKKISNKKAVIMGKLSTGFRINKAADDAAGMSIREKMRAQLNGLIMADRNVQDGISLVQTADGALSEMQNLVQRQRELCVQAANDTYVEEDRQKIQLEIDQLNQSIDDIANNTHFNTVPLLNITDQNVSGLENTGTGNPLALSVSRDGTFAFRTDKGYSPRSVDDKQILDYGDGYTSYPQIYIDGKTYLLRSEDSRVSVTPTIYDGATDTYNTVYTINGDVQVTQSIGIVGTDKNMYEIKYEAVNNGAENKSIGILFNIDTMLGGDDFALFQVDGDTIINEREYTMIPNEFSVYNNKENPFLKAKGILTGNFDGINIIKEPDKFGVGRWQRVDKWGWTPSVMVGDSAYSLWWYPEAISSGGNLSVNTFYGVSEPTSEEIEEGLGSFGKSVKLQVGAGSNQSLRIVRKSVTSDKLGTSNLFVNTSGQADRSINRCDKAISILSGERSKYGAYQNVLEHISNNLLNNSENLASAESRISDADIAFESMENAKASIQERITQAVMTQANSMSSSVLTLLK